MDVFDSALTKNYNIILSTLSVCGVNKVSCKQVKILKIFVKKIK